MKKEFYEIFLEIEHFGFKKIDDWRTESVTAYKWQCNISMLKWRTEEDAQFNKEMPCFIAGK